MSIGCHLEPTRTWIAQWHREIVAAVRVTVDGDNVASVDGLAILSEWRATQLPLMMIVTALEDGKSRGCLRVRFDPTIAVPADLATLIDARVLRDAGPSQASTHTEHRLNPNLRPNGFTRPTRTTWPASEPNSAY